MLSACPDKVNTEIEAQHTACYIYQTETHHLQGVYRSFVQNAKFVNAASVPHIHFMASCVVEMFGLDMAASYQQAFTAIRQLAVLLRGALSMRTKDAFRQVYCWQTLNCLELWAKVLAAHADKQVRCCNLQSASGFDGSAQVLAILLGDALSVRHWCMLCFRCKVGCCWVPCHLIDLAVECYACSALCLHAGAEAAGVLHASGAA